MLPLAINDQNKQFKIIFTTVYIGKFMIDRYFCFVPCSQGKCVTTQPGKLKVKLNAVNSMFLFGANTDFTAISVCLFVCLFVFFYFNNLL